MKERPILFSAPMVRALLDGSKTQTRRVVKPQPTAGDKYPPESPRLDADNMWRWQCGCVTYNSNERRCPYGQPGDRLWVRESLTFVPEDPVSGENCEIHCYTASIPPGKKSANPYESNYLFSGEHGDSPVLPHRNVNSIHMPRWASRITLEITNVRVERLQDISEADAIAEGVHRVVIGSGYTDVFAARETAWSDVIEQQAKTYANPIHAYRELWESINGPGSWDANPWVWVLEFKRI